MWTLRLIIAKGTANRWLCVFQYSDGNCCTKSDNLLMEVHVYVCMRVHMFTHSYAYVYLCMVLCPDIIVIHY
jgi:hypothetical protein